MKELLAEINRGSITTKNGYYFAKSKAQTTKEHRNKWVPFLELLESDSAFTVIYHDESQFRIFGNGPKSHIGPLNVHTEQEKALQHDEHAKTNVGPGFQVCTMISKDDLCVVRQTTQSGTVEGDGTACTWVESDGKPPTINSVGAERITGWVKSTQSKDKTTDNHESFLLSIEEGIKAQQRKHPKQTVVCVVDGAPTHTSLSGGMTPGEYILKADLEKLLQEQGYETTGMLQPEMMELYAKTSAFRARWSAAEELAEKLGAILLYLPNSHPYFNPIECLWRGGKSNYRKLGIKSMAALQEVINDYLGQDPSDESKASHARWHYNAQETRRHLFHNPDASHLTENDIKKKGKKKGTTKYVAQPWPEERLTPIKTLLNWQKGAKDVALYQRYAHYLNQVRIYSQGAHKILLSDVDEFEPTKIYDRGASEKRKKPKRTKKEKDRPATDVQELTKGKKKKKKKKQTKNSKDGKEEELSKSADVVIDILDNSDVEGAEELLGDGSSNCENDALGVNKRKQEEVEVGKRQRKALADAASKGEARRVEEEEREIEKEALAKAKAKKLKEEQFRAQQQKKAQVEAEKKKADERSKQLHHATRSSKQPLTTAADKDYSKLQPGAGPISQEKRDITGRVSSRDRYELESDLAIYQTHCAVELSRGQWNSLKESGAWLSSIMLERWILLCNAWMAKNDSAGPYLWLQLDVSARLFGTTDRKWADMEDSCVTRIQTLKKTKLLMPFCNNVHYWLFVIDLDSACVTLYDSDKGDRTWQPRFDKTLLIGFLKRLRPDKEFHFKRCQPKDQPRQVRGNCGIFVIETGRALIMELTPKDAVVEKNMDRHRAHIGEEIIACNLLEMAFHA